MFGRSFKHWTMTYVCDRLQVIRYARSNPDAPWLCQQAIEMLDGWLRPSDQGLEWGSGRSTLWFAQRVTHLTSIEHNQTWANTVKERLHATTLADRVDYRIATDGCEERDNSDYVLVAEQLGACTLDFCLVDGVSRDHCAVACLAKIKPGGILIIDNIERYISRTPRSRSPEARTTEQGPASEKWARFAEAVADWRCIWSTNGVWDTAIWFKPIHGA